MGMKSGRSVQSFPVNIRVQRVLLFAQCLYIKTKTKNAKEVYFEDQIVLAKGEITEVSVKSYESSCASYHASSQSQCSCDRAL